MNFYQCWLADRENDKPEKWWVLARCPKEAAAKVADKLADDRWRGCTITVATPIDMTQSERVRRYYVGFDRVVRTVRENKE